MPTSSSFNTRVFSPYVVLSGAPSSRFAITLKQGEGYTLPATGITFGDVLRYDPTNGYTLSQADKEENAEVVGIVENISGTNYTVVVYGSMIYPTDRLSDIVNGAAGGVDVLFLDKDVRGGLTGTIDLTTTSEKIIKPVFQVAPHGSYNGVVINYIGYKTGNQALVDNENALLSTGSIFYSVIGTTPGPNWLRIDSDVKVIKTDYPDLYEIYTDRNGSIIEKIVISSGTVSTSLVGSQIYQLSGGVSVNVGTITEVDVANSIIYAEKTTYSGGGPTLNSLMDTSKAIYVSTSTFSASSSSIYKFTIPAVVNTSTPTQNGVQLIPYIKAYEISTVKVPANLNISTLDVDGNLAVGALTNLENEINSIKSRLTTLENM